MIDKTIERDSFFDSLKFFLIALVIFGHCIEIGTRTRIGLALYNTIYSFHMPLFVFVSGYFSRKYDDLGSSFRKFFKLVETYLIFQIIFSLPSILSGDLFSMFMRPYWVLWYLFSLIIWRLFLQFAPPNLLKSNRWKMTFCIVTMLSLIAGFVPVGYELSFQRSMTFLLFFTIGYISANVKDIHIKDMLPSRLLSSLYFGLLFVAFYCVDKSYSSVFYGATPYSSLSGLSYRFIQLILGFMGGVCFMGLIKKIKLPHSLCMMGPILFSFLFTMCFS